MVKRWHVLGIWGQTPGSAHPYISSHVRYCESELQLCDRVVLLYEQHVNHQTTVGIFQSNFLHAFMASLQVNTICVKLVPLIVVSSDKKSCWWWYYSAIKIAFITLFVEIRKTVVAWIVRALLSHSVEDYILAIRGSNPAWDLCIWYHKYSH